MAQRRRRKRSFPPDVLKEIEDLSEKGITAAQITRELERCFDPAVTPKERTVQEIVRDLELHDESGAWSVADRQAKGDKDFATRAEETALILPVLTAVVEVTKNRTFVTRAEARWIARIRRLAPELDCWTVYRLARLYLRRETRQEKTEDLDLLLAFVSWRSHEANKRYEELWRSGRIPGPPMYVPPIFEMPVPASEMDIERDEAFGGPRERRVSSPPILPPLPPLPPMYQPQGLDENEKGEQS